MKLHEHQPKTLFRRYGIQTPAEVVVTAADDVDTVFASFQAPRNIQAQVDAGASAPTGRRMRHAVANTAGRASRADDLVRELHRLGALTQISLA